MSTRQTRINRELENVHVAVSTAINRMTQVVSDEAAVIRANGLVIEDDEHTEANGWERLDGDAGKSHSLKFQVWLKRETTQTRIAILCPTYLRGPLTLHALGAGRVGASY
jgi:hypothetical protein